MRTRALAAVTALLFISSTVTVFAQKSRRILREEGLAVQSSAPVGQSTVDTGASPELYGTDGGATKSSVPGSTGVTALTGQVQDTTATLLSAGNGAVVPVVTAATAATAYIPTTSNDQNMMLPLLAALASALGGGNNGAKAGTGTTGATNNNPNTAATTPAANTPAASTPATAATSPTGQRHDQSEQTPQTCSNYTDRDQINPPFRDGFTVFRCHMDQAGPPTRMNFLPLRKNRAKPESRNVYPIAKGQVIGIDRDTAYGCRITIKHDPCPVKGVTASGACFTVYSRIGAYANQSGKCPDTENELKKGDSVDTDKPIGRTQSQYEYSPVGFEFRLPGGQLVPTEKYECAFTTHSQIERTRRNSRCRPGVRPEGRDRINTSTVEPAAAPSGVQ